MKILKTDLKIIKFHLKQLKILINNYLESRDCPWTRTAAWVLNSAGIAACLGYSLGLLGGGADRVCVTKLGSEGVECFNDFW